jgi:integral membrane protein
MNSTKAFNLFRKTGIAEGISFLVLLLIAMPLKYFAGFPIAVTIAGSLHGILFIAYLLLACETRNESIVTKWKKSFAWMATCFLASILPFGPFVLENRLKKEQVRQQNS